jgi:hypothetical protein
MIEFFLLFQSHQELREYRKWCHEWANRQWRVYEYSSVDMVIVYSRLRCKEW